MWIAFVQVCVRVHMCTQKPETNVDIFLNHSPVLLRQYLIRSRDCCFPAYPHDDLPLPVECWDYTQVPQSLSLHVTVFLTLPGQALCGDPSS